MTANEGLRPIKQPEIIPVACSRSDQKYKAADAPVFSDQDIMFIHNQLRFVVCVYFKH